MATARLNIDVLGTVSEYLTDVFDVLSLSLVCSSIRPLATRRLLSMRPVHIKDYGSAQNFHAFLFTDAVTRAPHIHALHIGGLDNIGYRHADQRPSFSTLVIDIITSCPQLEHIWMFFESDYADDEPIVIAIVALQGLRSLTISGWSSHALDLLHRVSSHLRKLVILSNEIQYPSSLEEFLPRLAPTLEELELLSLRLRPHHMPWLMHDVSGSSHSLFDGPQYPAVRSLFISCFVARPLLDHLHHLFPGLEGTLSLGLLDGNLNTSCYQDIRAANQLAQERSQAWMKLDRVICDAPMLYLLALRCPIRLVMLDKGSAETLHYATDALRENPVPHLKLTLKYGRGMLDGIFSPELAAELSHLTLCLVYDNEHKTRPRPQPCDFAHLVWDELLDAMLSALEHLPNLTHLRVVVHCRIGAIPFSVPHPPLAHSPKFVDAVRGPAFDFERTAASLVRALPSLQHIFLTTSGNLASLDESTRAWRSHERWNVSRAWRVAKPGAAGPPAEDPSGVALAAGGNATLVELHSEVAETIIRNEELILSETDEYSLYKCEH